MRSSGAIEVRTSRGNYEAERLVLAPGPWASQLFKIDWLPLEVQPQQLHWFEPLGGAAAFAADRFPIYIWDLGAGVQFYGFPADDEGRVKVAFFRSKVTGEEAIREALKIVKDVDGIGSGDVRAGRGQLSGRAFAGAGRWRCTTAGRRPRSRSRAD